MSEEMDQPTTETATHDPLNLMGEQTTAIHEKITAAALQPKSRRKIRVGTVVSNKMQKSIVVAVVRRVRHPLYKKYFNKTKKYMAHDETNDCKVGDTVRIIETRPLSARKRWAVDTIVERAK